MSSIFDVTLVVCVDDEKFLRGMNLNVKVVHLPISRNIALAKDMKALFHLLKILKAEKFDIIHTIAPKAGLLGMLAGIIMRIPVRIHVFQGEVWATQKGFVKRVLKNVDKLVAYLATEILVVSESERQFLLKNRVVTTAKSTVLGYGSICGVDMGRFKSNSSVRDEMRAAADIADTDQIVLFVGRINRDKGVFDLVDAFVRLRTEYKSLRLWLVGPDEENISNELKRVSPVINIFPYTDEPEKFMMASDLLVLPSYREGFGLVLIEAAAVGMPTVASDIYGIQDAIEDKVTGLLYPAGNKPLLVEKIKILLDNPAMRQQMGSAGVMRCQARFRQAEVVGHMLAFYRGLPVRDKKTHDDG